MPNGRTFVQYNAASFLELQDIVFDKAGSFDDLDAFVQNYLRVLLVWWRINCW